MFFVYDNNRNGYAILCVMVLFMSINVYLFPVYFPSFCNLYYMFFKLLPADLDPLLNNGINHISYTYIHNLSWVQSSSL